MNVQNKVTITKLDDNGRGIGYLNNKIIFIPNTLPDEEVYVSISKETKKYFEGKVIKYIKKSDKRVVSPCPYFDKCGGCSLFHMTYNDSIEYKKNKIKNILKKFANINPTINVIKNDKVFNYRNKIELKIKDYKWGYYNYNTHEFISINECLLASNPINKVIENKHIFDIKNGSITIRNNYNNEVIIAINTKDNYKVDINELKNIIKLVGIIINDKVIYGESYFIENINNKLFKVNYNSFFQVNLNITAKMIDIIKENCYKDTLLDLYCGVGFLGQMVSESYKKIYGIEINENSIMDAIKNSEINNIKNTYYICGDASNAITKINDNIDTIIIDPPRSGLVKNMINDILNIKAKRLIYISCNPISLARDLNILKDYYEIDNISMLDMFSNTYHVECVSLLCLKNTSKSFAK